MNKKDLKNNIIIKKNKTKKIKQKPKILITSIKIAIIIFLIFGFYYTSSSFSNTINLLAVSEDSNGNTKGGSLIKLNLKIKPGSGETFVNLNTLEELDTQISIINSQKIACDLFKLNCENYNFYYDFEGSALVLKGPSASSAIAILVAKTIKKNKISEKTVITGSLNSGGIIGNVGGIEEKIKIAQENKFEKVLIPVFSQYELNNQTTIEVIKVMDIIEAYNNFNQDSYSLKAEPINKTSYTKLMKKLSNDMCERTNEIKEQINFKQIKVNSSKTIYEKAGNKSYNSSTIAFSNNNFYSQGSFCYNANINYRILYELQNNLSDEKRTQKINQLKKELEIKYVLLNSNEYKKNITTTNDFYVYLLLQDRLEEARDFIKEAEKLEENKITSILNNLENKSNSSIILNKSKEINKTNNQKDILYSYSLERYNTVKLWEQIIQHSGSKIKFDDDKIDEACLKINRDIKIKSELLNNYGFNYLNEEIEKQYEYSSPFKNKYLCIYKGLELNGRINTILNSVGIEQNQTEILTQKILNFTQTRISLNSNGEFPLIPFIYLEYAGDLYKQKDFSSALLYSNYALTYSDLNLYLEKDQKATPFINKVYSEILNNLWSLGAILVILAFLN